MKKRQQIIKGVETFSEPLRRCASRFVSWINWELHLYHGDVHFVASWLIPPYRLRKGYVGHVSDLEVHVRFFFLNLIIDKRINDLKTVHTWNSHTTISGKCAVILNSSGGKHRLISLKISVNVKYLEIISLILRHLFIYNLYNNYNINLGYIRYLIVISTIKRY